MLPITENPPAKHFFKAFIYLRCRVRDLASLNSAPRWHNVQHWSRSKAGTAFRTPTWVPGAQGLGSSAAASPKYISGKQDGRLEPPGPEAAPVGRGVTDGGLPCTPEPQKFAAQLSCLLYLKCLKRWTWRKWCQLFPVGWKVSSRQTQMETFAFWSLKVSYSSITGKYLPVLPTQNELAKTSWTQCVLVVGPWILYGTEAIFWPFHTKNARGGGGAFWSHLCGL